MKVKVIKLGNYKKGTILEMHPTTAEACIKNGAVEKVEKPKK